MENEKNRKHALITGVTGQDGAYLGKLLLDKDYEVYGIYRRISTPNFWRLQTLDIFEKVHLIPADVTDMASILEAITIAEPDEIYNLAAQSFVGASFEKPLMTTDVNSLGLIRILEAVRLLNPKIKVYQASSSEIYGNVNSEELPINEGTPMIPVSPYGVAKLSSYHIARIYRESYGLFVANGILFNHESPLRGLEFVSRKVSNAVAKISLGLQEKLSLGNLEAKRDWGFAPEYVEAMWLMLQYNIPEDLVMASGEAHSVKDLVKLAFECVGIEQWKDYVKMDNRFLRPLDLNVLLGDYSKAKATINWKPKTGFEELVKLMVEEDLNKWKRYLKGEFFPWDAPNYPTEATIVTRALRL